MSNHYQMEINLEAISLSTLVNESRIWSRLMELAEIGRIGETGVNRAAFSAEDRAARQLLVQWASPLGVDVYQDEIANLFFRYGPPNTSERAVLTGSHLDSQPSGGRFDGVYGVVAGLEVLEVFREARARFDRPVEVVVWSNEEGSRFAPGAMGSQFYAGFKSLDDLGQATDSKGFTLVSELSQTIASIPEAKSRTNCDIPFAYVEAHIEQGPVLENNRIQIGAVEGIQGCIWIEYDVIGRAAHAGTTPLEDRKDALREAIRLIQLLEIRCRDVSPKCLLTVGRLMVEPGSPNTVPGRVKFTIDLRERDMDLFVRLKDILTDIDRIDRCSVTVSTIFEHTPRLFAIDIVNAVEDSASKLGFSVARMMSGAFHDALFVSKKCRAGMVFVPSKDGISHHPDEYSTPDQLTAGTKVLASVLGSLANELEPDR